MKARRVRIALIALATLLGLPLAAGSAVAAEEPQPQIMTVLDASGSMKERDAGGQSRLAAAKSAVTGLLDDVPEGTALGLRVYGATYPGEDTGSGCRDTQLLSPVAKMDDTARQKAKSEVRGIKAVGMTPIGSSLKTAAKDLGDSGPRRIILVSDGEDTCAPPTACDVARDLKGAGIDLTVDTVGFKVGAKARAELRCIAKATGGEYVDAGDADELGDELAGSVKRALTPYAVSGTKVHGAESCESAPVLEPGQYQDAMEYRQSHWYKVRVRPGQALRFSSAVIPDGPYENASYVRARLHLPGESRPFADEQQMESFWANVISTGVVTDRMTWGQMPDKKASTLVCAQVVNDVQAAAKKHPVELSVGVEGQAVGPDGKPATDAGAEAGKSTPDTSASDARNAGASSDSLMRPLPIAAAVLGGLLLAALIRPAVTRRRTP
ncbi:von Willebrand factor type A domain protein [Streptomyces sp. YIM 130001]|uniref:vWA domain-containing protein n=1 Tax=Streptomyces sp. YIM 130001 TaxID=2259644 RepID=UPI000E649755|nr:VWA domain-containing protein [Streptomyces sp. YIM 130001]RII07964.1 von Willebrand factor type A domain protein [Streptomyces sp. YIM 130001]